MKKWIIGLTSGLVLCSALFPLTGFAGGGGIVQSDKKITYSASEKALVLTETIKNMSTTATYTNLRYTIKFKDSKGKVIKTCNDVVVGTKGEFMLIPQQYGKLTIRCAVTQKKNVKGYKADVTFEYNVLDADQARQLAEEVNQRTMQETNRLQQQLQLQQQQLQQQMQMRPMF